MKKILFAIMFSSTAISCAYAQNTQQPSLPGGATSLNETFLDWAISCAVQNAVKMCVLSQQQTQENGSLVLQVNMAPHNGGAITTFILPFGLLNSEGVTYQIDGKGNANRIDIKACYPVGCIAEVSMTPAQVQAMKTGTKVILGAKTADNSSDFKLNISLKGFSAAYDRAAALVK